MHSARNASSLARTRDLIHSKQDVAFNQTEEQKNFSNKVAGKNITYVMQVNDTALLCR